MMRVQSCKECGYSFFLEYISIVLRKDTKLLAELLLPKKDQKHKQKPAFLITMVVSYIYVPIMSYYAPL